MGRDGFGAGSTPLAGVARSDRVGCGCVCGLPDGRGIRVSMVRCPFEPKRQPDAFPTRWRAKTYADVMSFSFHIVM